MTDLVNPPSGGGPRLTRRSAMIGGVLACASGLAFVRQPAIANPIIEEDAFQAAVPKEFGKWETVARSGVVLPPPDALRDRLYDNLVTRVYVAPNKPPVMLLLAYNNAQDGVLQVHRPEVCYPAGGFQLTETRAIPLQVGGATIPANIFTATGPDRVEQVAYFTRLGETFPRSWAEQRLAVVRANLDGDIPDGMMMRVSLLGLDQSRAQRVLSDFTAQFISSSSPLLRKLLLGSNT